MTYRAKSVVKTASVLGFILRGKGFGDLELKGRLEGGA